MSKTHIEYGFASQSTRCCSSERRMASSARSSAVVSRAIADAPTTRPLASRIGETVNAMSISCPFLCRRLVTMRSIDSPAATRAKFSASGSSLGGITNERCRPIASDAV